MRRGERAQLSLVLGQVRDRGWVPALRCANAGYGAGAAHVVTMEGLQVTERGKDRALVSRRAAQTKITQAVAKYQATPNGTDHCEICAKF